jgi:hypothetical protein
MAVPENKHRLGRLFHPDDRDACFRLNLFTGTKSKKRKQRGWDDDDWSGDQGYTPQCVAYAWTHWLVAGPVKHPERGLPPGDPADLYYMAQRVDEWAGTDYDGTSVRAGAKVLQAHGAISNYYWAMNVKELIYAVLEMGPVVVGTLWFENMSQPSRNGYCRPTGAVEGGHAYLISGVNLKRNRFRIKNSWGLNWGRKGRAFINIGDMAKLLAWDGEACVATEQPLRPLSVI